MQRPAGGWVAAVPLRGTRLAACEFMQCLGGSDSNVQHLQQQCVGAEGKVCTRLPICDAGGCDGVAGAGRGRCAWFGGGVCANVWRSWFLRATCKLLDGYKTECLLV
jgi:hypothetical protein